MTIEALQAEQTALALPPRFEEALEVLERAENTLPTHIETSRSEAAIYLSRAFNSEQQAVMEAAAEISPDISRAQRLLMRAQHMVDRILDDSLVLANSTCITKHLSSVKDAANDGDKFAQRILKEQFAAGDTTGGFIPPQVGEDAGAANFSALIASQDYLALEHAQADPVELEVVEAEVILAAPIVELKKAIDDHDKPTIVELSGAVRLVIGHVGLDELVQSPYDAASQRFPIDLQ